MDPCSGVVFFLFFPCADLVWSSRHGSPYITLGHFDAVPGELRLKAWESRMMTSFLAVCCRTLRARMTNEDVELDLCLLLTTKISNWSLDLEQCPIELDLDQSLRLHDLGMESLIKKKWKFCMVIWVCGKLELWSCPKHICQCWWKHHSRIVKTYKALSIYFLNAGVARFPLRPKIHVACLQQVKLKVLPQQPFKTLSMQCPRSGIHWNPVWAAEIPGKLPQLGRASYHAMKFWFETMQL